MFSSKLNESLNNRLQFASIISNSAAVFEKISPEKYNIL